MNAHIFRLESGGLLQTKTNSERCVGTHIYRRGVGHIGDAFDLHDSRPI